MSDYSYDDVQQYLQQELVEQFGNDAYGTALYVLLEVFTDYLIAGGPDSKIFRFTYSLDDSGEATLGPAQEVEAAYVPVAQEAQFLTLEAVQEDGFVWPVQIITAGPAQGAVDNRALPHVYTPSVVAEFASAV